MATRSDISNILAYLLVAFPNFHPSLDGEVTSLDVWFDLLGHLPADALKTACKSCCATPGRAFAPSPGEIIGAVTQMQAQASGMPSAGEAWAAIIEGFNHTSFDQPAMLQHPAINEDVRQMGGMDIIGLSENVMAERAHFLKLYQALVDRELANAAQIPAVRDFVERQRIEVSDEIRKLSDKMARPRLEAK